MSLPTQSLPVYSSTLPVFSSTAMIAQNGVNEAAFVELFTRHQQMVYRVCLRYLGHHHDAEDVTQETFRRAALALPEMDFQRPIEPWLVTIAANRCRTLLSRRQHDRLTQRLDEESSLTRIQPDSTHRLALEEELNLAIGRLPEHHRRAFELVHQRELSYPEAAGVMGRSIGTVKTWVRRAKLAMQHSLLAENDRSETTTTAAPSDKTHCRPSVAARWIASALLLAGLYAGGRNAPFLANLGHPATSATPAALARSAGAAGMPLNAGTAQPSSAPGQNEGELSAPVDWQLVSLDTFSKARFSVENIHSLPVTDWIDRSSPTLDHLRLGIEPLSKTLQRVVLLFQCELAAIAPSPAIRLPLESQTSDVPSLTRPNAFSIEIEAAMRSLTSIT